MTKLIMIALKLLIFNFVFFCINNCGTIGVDKDYDYKVMIDNQTSDTLVWAFNDSIVDAFQDKVLIPNDTTCVSSILFDKDQDAIEALFSDGKHEYYSMVCVFRNDSLKIMWKGPSFEKPDSVHSFFNYNSWESCLIDNNEGIIQFSITEDDF